MRRLGRVGIGLAFLAWPVVLCAQTGSVRGRVADSAGAAIAGAVLTVDGTGLRATSDARGGFEIRGVPSGDRTVRARLLGFQPVASRVTVAAGGVVEQNIVMARAAVQLEPIAVVTGSRARHTAAEELAVPVDIFGTEQIARVATTETNQVLQELSPAISFPRQSVADASDIVRPFTMRGLNPDHTLVLVNGLRRHRTALVHVFNAGMGAGGSGVDLNALPAGAIDRIEVLREGAAAQYGSDAIAGVVNVVLKDGDLPPWLTGEFGRHVTADYPDDGNLYSLSGGWGVRVGRGSLGLFGEYRDRKPTNRAGADNTDQIVTGDADVVDADGKVVQKNNQVPQPNHHWGDGREEDILTMANLRLPVGQGNTELYAFGGYSHRFGTGNGYRRVGLDDRNWLEIYPLGYLPQFEGKVTDWSAAAGLRGLLGQWAWDAGGAFGYDNFDYDLTNTMNVSLGPCTTTPCAPGPDGILGNADDPGIPNKKEIYAGSLRLNELTLNLNLVREIDAGLASPLNVAVGGQFRRESYEIVAGELASYVQGGHLNRFGDVAPAGSQVFPGFRPEFAGDHSRTNVGVYADLEGELAREFLANVAGRFESYSDFGSRVTGKLAFRWQPSTRWTFRASGSTGFRAPALSQSHFASIITNFAADPVTGDLEPFEVGIFPVDHPASVALGAKPLEEEKSTNVSAGFAVSPDPAFTFTADVFYINVDDRILLTNELSGDDVKAILANAGVDATAARYFTNALDTETKGVDVTGTWRGDVGGSTRLELTGYVNFTRNRIVAIRVPPELQGTDADFFNPFNEGGTIALERERPEWRAGLGALLSGAAWDASARASYYGDFQSALFGYDASTLQTYGAKMLVDVEVGYRLAGMFRLALGARNVFDTYPDRLSVDNGFGLFLHPPGSPFGYNGRFIYGRVEWMAR
ncbi:MAG TPA: TonB-dependent receptor [Gemmatimonadales bacterium]